ELTRRRRGEERLDAEQLRQPRVAAQDIEIQQTMTPEQTVPTQTQDVLRLRVAALALLEVKVVIKQLGDAQLLDEVAQQHDARVRRQPVSAETDIEVASFADCRSIHLTGASFRITRMLVAPLFYAVWGAPVAIFKE